MTPILAAKRSKDGRKAPRLRSHQLKCSIGEIVDFSASGLRVAIRQRHPGVEVGQRLDVLIDDPEEPFSVTATVVWVRTTGVRSHLAGLRLEGVTAEVRAQLLALARAPEIGPLTAGDNVA